MAYLDDLLETFEDSPKLSLEHIVRYPRGCVDGLLYVKLGMASIPPQLYRDWIQEMPLYFSKMVIYGWETKFSRVHDP